MVLQATTNDKVQRQGQCQDHARTTSGLFWPPFLFLFTFRFSSCLFLSFLSILFDIRHSSPSRYTLQDFVSWPAGRTDYAFSLRVNWVTGFTRAAPCTQWIGLMLRSGIPCRTTSSPLQGAGIASDFGFCNV